MAELSVPVFPFRTRGAQPSSFSWPRSNRNHLERLLSVRYVFLLAILDEDENFELDEVLQRGNQVQT
jgi:hypothetical protein